MGNSTFVFVVFILVYLGMIFGRLPRLALDRTGIVVLGAIALLASGHASLEGGRSGVSVSTLLLHFGFMVISAQFRLVGLYLAAWWPIDGLPASSPAPRCQWLLVYGCPPRPGPPTGCVRA